MGFGSIATTAANGIMGLMLGDYADERQYNQQQRLQGLQMRGQKEMTDYEMQKQWEMWQKTNFPAQLEMMKKAGLSPGLMYGKGGAGGTTTGSASGSVTGASAPTGGGEIQSMIGLGMQKQLQEAQIENIKAQTENTKVQTEKTAGVDSGLVRTQILLNTVGVDTERAKQGLMAVQTRMGEIENEIKGRTVEDSVRYIGWAAEKTMQEMTDWRYKNNINEEVWQDKVQQVRADLWGTWLRNALTKATTTNVQTGTEAIIRQGIQKWKELEISARNASTGERRAADDAWINDVQKSTGIPMEILREAVDGIMRGVPRGPKNTYREGQDARGRDWWESTQHY